MSEFAIEGNGGSAELLGDMWKTLLNARNVGIPVSITSVQYGSCAIMDRKYLFGETHHIHRDRGKVQVI
jgi:hypothetical protein